MKAFLLSLAAIAFTSAPNAVDAQIFNGEVLIAPPPANWTGGAPVKTDQGRQREWKRNFLIEGGVVERIVVTRSEKKKEHVASVVARALSKVMTADCAKPSISRIKSEKAKIGTTASFTAQCANIKDTNPDTALFAIATIYVGDFHTYTVQRSWLGNKDDPGSPANSPRTGTQWATYFNRIAVCNTLTDACDPAKAEIIHAHPRFTTMRALPVSAKPVVTVAEAVKAAKGVGTLTGRAETCGEDVEPLTSKIDRMLSYVTANDQDSTRALKAFKSAMLVGSKDQAKKPKESCGQVLREFRQHPSRVGAFYRYIERFL